MFMSALISILFFPVICITLLYLFRKHIMQDLTLKMFQLAWNEVILYESFISTNISKFQKATVLIFDSET